MDPINHTPCETLFHLDVGRSRSDPDRASGGAALLLTVDCVFQAEPGYRVMSRAQPSTRALNGRKMHGEGFDRPLATGLFCLIVASCALLGGSSRYDASRLLLLQPLGCVLLGLAWIRTRNVPHLRPLLLFLGAVTIWLILQIVPLPYGIWSKLPGREPFAGLASALYDTRPRPFSLAPYRTLNILATMPLLFAAVLGTGLLGRRAASLAVLGAIAVAVASACLGMVQYLAPGTAFFTYDITNPGSPVGLFANRNHAAVYNSFTMLLVTGWLCGHRQDPGARIAAVAVLSLLLLVNLVNGSRAGILTTAIALMGSAVMLLLVPAGSAAGRSQGWRRPAPLILGGLAWLWALIGTLALSGKVQSVARLVNGNPLDDLRFEIQRTLRQMIGVYWPTGSGAGSFEQVYYVHEDVHLLGSTYLNMAHNDIFQLVIEGGIPALMLTLLMAGIGIRSLVQLRRQGALPAWLICGVIAGTAILALASYVDYPLRTPLYQAVILMLFAAVAQSARRSIGRMERI